jgi:hypothetical protein
MNVDEVEGMNLKRDVVMDMDVNVNVIARLANAPLRNKKQTSHRDTDSTPTHHSLRSVRSS